MAKFLIYKREGEELGAKLGSYEASQKDDTSANRSWLMAEPMAFHIELPEEMDEDCVLIQWVEEQELEPENEGEAGIIIPAHWALVEDEELVVAKAAKAIDDTIARALDNAIAFGNEIMKEFTRENIKMGITADGMTGTVRKNMSEVILALTTGSLYDAITEAKAIPAEDKDVKYITDVRLLSFVNKIEAYLGAPLSEEI